MHADQPQLPQSLHDAAAGPRFSTINLSPLTPAPITPETLSKNPASDSTVPVESTTLSDQTTLRQDQQAVQETLLTADSQPPQAQSSGTTLAGVAVAAGAGLLLWALWQWGRGGRGRRATSRREATFQSRVQAAAQTPIAPSTPSPAHQQLIAAADRIARQLEQRAGQLERFIEQADHRIIELKRLSMTPVAPRADAIKAPTASTPAATSAAARTTFPRSTREAAKPATQGQPTSPLTNTQTRAASPTLASITASSNSAAASLSIQHAEVHALADAGLTPVEIAQRLSKPTGQIELILNLRKAAMVA